ncbi:MAG TPA: ABC transporter ATP-binding protein, partial [Acidimicrobiales bacterium]
MPSVDTTAAPRVLRAYLGPYRRSLAALAVALVAATGLPLAAPQLLRRFVDQATAGEPQRLLTGTALAYLTVAIGGQLVTVIATYGASRIAWGTANQLREDLVEHVLRLDLAWHGGHTAGELIERVDGDVTSLAQFISRFLFQMLGSALLLAGAVVLVFREDWRVGAVLVAFLVATTLAVVRGQRVAQPLAEVEREAAAQLVGNVEERLAGAEEIRALAAADHVLRRFHEATGAAYRANVRYERVAGGLAAGTRLAFALGTAAMVGAGIALMRRGALSVGTVVLLFQYTVMVRRPLENVIQQFKEFQVAAAGAARVVQLLHERPTIVERPAASVVPLPATGALGVRFDHVTFAYAGDPPVLHDVTLDLAPGRSLGLVGRTGSGKSTMARLLLRLYDATHGAVLVGGVDVRDVAFASLRSRVRLVTQDVQLFGASVRDNLTVFAERVDDRGDDARMVDVLGELGLAPWYRSLPDGLDTRIGAGAIGVSAGEAQLLAFARVFLADPGLVLLDEASSRLDPSTEQLIDRAIDKLFRDRTVVVIAHRLSSLERVDEIAVVDD